VSKESFYEEFIKAKEFCQFDSKYAHVLPSLKDTVMARRVEITDQFYTELGKDSGAVKILEGRQIDQLKEKHMAWMEELFSGDYGRAYFDYRYHVGQIHVGIKVLPYYVEVVMSLLRREICQTILEQSPGNVEGVAAILAVLDLELLIILGAYQEDRLDRLFEITGIGRPLLERLVTFSE